MTPEERRTFVLETAARLFATKGFASTTIEDITDELGVSKAVFYYYWNNKREVLREIHRRAIEALNRRLEAVLASPLSPAERIAALVKNHIDVIVRHRSLCWSCSAKRPPRKTRWKTAAATPAACRSLSKPPSAPVPSTRPTTPRF